jgi:methionine--tRNA ligase beta chain
MVTIDDFKKLNIVVGTIESAEEIEGSEKLLKFMINIGSETRQILGGLKPSYTPADLIGKQVLIIENLEPRKLMGIESQGMILCPSDEDGKPVIVQPLKNVPNGAIIK